MIRTTKEEARQVVLGCLLENKGEMTVKQLTKKTMLGMSRTGLFCKILEKEGVFVSRKETIVKKKMFGKTKEEVVTYYSIAREEK